MILYIQYMIIYVQNIIYIQYLKSTWHSPYILVYTDPLLTYLLVSVPSILTLRYTYMCVCICRCYTAIDICKQLSLKMRDP